MKELKRLSSKEAIYLDLDGTIVNSYEGIYNGFMYAFKKKNLKMPEMDINQFIGPPISDTMSKLFSDENIEDVIATYREYYIKKGLFECNLYEGMEDTLINLKDKGYRLYVATSKPQNMAEDVLKYLRVDKFFLNIYGANDETGSGAKKLVLAYALEDSKEDNSKSLMIGDSVWDYQGARANDMDFGAVLYGFGIDESITHKDNYFTVNKPVDILQYL